MSEVRAVVLVGGGHASASAASELRRRGFNGRVQILSEEAAPPYDRTTLSKEALKSGSEPPALVLDATTAGGSEVEISLLTTVSTIDPATRRVYTGDGQAVSYDRLLIATGAEPRKLTVPGSRLNGVHYLRNYIDAQEISKQFKEGERLVVIGAGLIGLEVASCARELGLEVSVVEAAPRPLARSVPSPVASALTDLHRRHGIVIHCGVPPLQLLGTGGQVCGVELADGRRLDTDIVIVGIGVVPRVEVAEAAGLSVADGLLVDRQCRTSNDRIFGAGDVVRMRNVMRSEPSVRLEAWEPACRQGEVAAAAMLGEATEYADVPWGWSDQFDAVVQVVGVQPAGAEEIVFGDLDGPAGLVTLVAQEGRVVGAAGVSVGPAIAKPVGMIRQIMNTDVPFDAAELGALQHEPGRLREYLRHKRRNRPSIEPVHTDDLGDDQ